MSCDWRLVASEEELIEAATEGCRVIHCRNSTTIGPAFFTSDALPLRSNLTLSGSANLRWVESQEDLWYVREIYNRSATSAENAKQVLPISSPNVLEMLSFELKASATSLEVFMDMMVDPAPGPGELVLRNTTWTVVDCTVQTLMYTYTMFHVKVRPEVFPQVSQVDLNTDTIIWDSNTFSQTVPHMPAKPLPQVDIDAGNWTAAQTISMYNFSVGCAQVPDAAAAGLPPGQPECTSRTVHTESELIQAQLDDCRFIVALPKRRSDGTLADPVTLSSESYLFDHATVVNISLSGVLQVENLSTGTRSFNSIMVGPSTWMQLWYLDVIADFQQHYNLLEATRTGGPGKVAMLNSRFIVTGCSSAAFSFMEQVMLTVLTNPGVAASDVRVDPERKAIHYINVSATTEAPGLGGGFSSPLSFEVLNLSVICVEEWDVEDSLAHYALSEGQVPPSLRPAALGMPAGAEAGTPSVAPAPQEGTGTSVPTEAVVGGVLGGLAALAIAAALLIFVVVRHQRKRQHPDGVSAEGHMHDQNGGEQDHRALDFPEGSGARVVHSAQVPATLLQDADHLRTLLDAEPCVNALTQAVGKRVMAQAPAAAGCSTDSSPTEGGTPRIEHTPALDGPFAATGVGLPGTDRWPATAWLEAPGSAVVMEQQQDTIPSAGISWVQHSVAALIECLPLREGVDLQVDLCRDVTLGRVLGEGHGSIVYEGWWRCGTEREQHVAVKMLDMAAINTDKEKEAFLASFRHELHLLTRIDHPCIVRCYGGCATPASACLLLEYMAGGTLAEYVHERRTRQPLSLGELLSITIQISAALAFLHPVILHADVKPDNCLLTADGHVKLGDFGLSKAKWRSAVQPSRVLGTPPYTAPEMLHGSLVSEKCDIFSLAVLLWECCTNDFPWKDITNTIQLYNLVKTEGRRPPLPESCHPSLAALITKCWHPNPELRPSAVEVARKAEILLATLVDSPDAEACPSGVATMERGMPQGAAEA